MQMELYARTNVHVYPLGGVICSVQTNMTVGGGAQNIMVFSTTTTNGRKHPTTFSQVAHREVEVWLKNYQYVINEQHLSVGLCSSNLNMPLNNIFASIKTACMQNCVVKM